MLNDFTLESVSGTIQALTQEETFLTTGHVLWIVYSESGKYFHLYSKRGICEGLSAHKNMEGNQTRCGTERESNCGYFEKKCLIARNRTRKKVLFTGGTPRSKI